MVFFKISNDGKKKDDISCRCEQSFIMYVVTKYAYGFIEGKYGTENDARYIGKYWIC